MRRPFGPTAGLLELSVLIEHFAAATAALSAGRQEGGVMAEAAAVGKSAPGASRVRARRSAHDPLAIVHNTCAAVRRGPGTAKNTACDDRHRFSYFGRKFPVGWAPWQGWKKWGSKMKGRAERIHPVFGRILGLIILGSLLAGCDQCGDWWGTPDQSQSCKGQLPAQH